MFAPLARPALACVGILGAAVALAACGGGSSGSGSDAQQQITAMLSTGLTSEDPAVICTRTIGKQLLGAIYTTESACIAAEKKDAASSDRATAVKVSAIKVGGDRGTAVVGITGGDQDGASGEVSLIREDGGWRIADLSTALLRSQLKQGVANDSELPDALKTCIADKVLALDDTAFRSLAYGSMGDKPAAAAQLNAIAGGCAEDSSGSGSGSGSGSSAAEVLREKFEEGVGSSLKDQGASAAQVSCVMDRLRSGISDQQLADLVKSNGQDVPAQVTSVTAQAVIACGIGNSGT